MQLPNLYLHQSSKNLNISSGWPAIYSFICLCSTCSTYDSLDSHSFYTLLRIRNPLEIFSNFCYVLVDIVIEQQASSMNIETKPCSNQARNKLTLIIFGVVSKLAEYVVYDLTLAFDVTNNSFRKLHCHFLITL